MGTWFRLFVIATAVAILYVGYPYIFPEPQTVPSQSKTTPASPSPSLTPSVALATLGTSTTDPSAKRFGAWLYQKGFDLNPQVLSSIESILSYADSNHIEHNQILTLIDYSIPANQKRLWVLDLDAQKVLFHTYVSHGLKSGSLETNFFSNRFDSKASSIGVYRTNKTYYGRHGLSLKLDGLDRGFNDNADPRAIVMHGGWYVEEAFIKKYGRAGRSWGCPAVPDQLTATIINTIKDKSLFVVYYPSSEWFAKSRFLQGDLNESFIKLLDQPSNLRAGESERRDDVLLAQIQKKHKYQETEAVLAIPADRYSALFQTRVPLERMLRRQVEDQEYIALSKTEFDQLISLYPQNTNTLQDLCFIMPEVKMVRGYYVTEMNKIKMGSITEVHPNNPIPSRDGNYYTVYFSDHPSIALKTTHRFIRWLGL